MRTKTSALFPRLLFYFLAVMLIPTVLLTLFYWGLGQRDFILSLQNQANLHLANASTKLEEVLENYRHKVYLLSTESIIQEAIKSPETTDRSDVYKQIYSIMSGDTYSATGTVLSTDAHIRYSSHIFPDQYDTRYNTSVSSPFYELNNSKSTQSYMSLIYRYISDTNVPIIINIMRKIENNLGYAVVDVFFNAFSDLPDMDFFTDLVLVDTRDFYATSLTRSDRFGDLTAFPQIDINKLEDKFDQKDSNLVVSSAIKDTQFILVGILNTQGYVSSFSNIFSTSAFFLFIGLIFATILALLFTRSISKPVTDLTQGMKMAQTGKLDTKVKESKVWEFNELDKAFNQMISQISTLMELNQQAEKKALEAQMNPHFLYNTLNTIKSIAKLNDQQEILTIVVQLGKLLRASINNTSSSWTLKESIDLVNSYLSIQQIRFKDKLKVSLDIDTTILDMKTPKLIIQPLIENAIGHGLEPKIGDWLLSLSVKKIDDFVCICIKDNGVGFDSENFNIENLKNSNHIGIYNIYQRLKIAYGDKASLKIDSKPDLGTQVTINIPFIGE